MRNMLRKVQRFAAARPDFAAVALAVALCVVRASIWRTRSSPLLREAFYIRPSEARYALAVTIVRPQGTGPFGAIVLNHGTGATPAARLAESPALFLHTATAF